MEVSAIYKEIDRIIVKHKKINDKAMKLTQSWGYNGFKRLHRVNTKKLMCEHLKIENDMFDKYQQILDSSSEIISYDPTSLKTHLSKWKDILYEDIYNIAKLNYEHIQSIGVSNDIAKCVLAIFQYDYEKVCRWYKRFNDSNFDLVDIHIVDDYIHKKYKEIED